MLSKIFFERTAQDRVCFIDIAKKVQDYYGIISGLRHEQQVDKHPVRPSLGGSELLGIILLPDYFLGA
jgi:hypothetical protein